MWRNSPWRASINANGASLHRAPPGAGSAQHGPSKRRRSPCARRAPISSSWRRLYPASRRSAAFLAAAHYGGVMSALARAPSAASAAHIVGCIAYLQVFARSAPSIEAGRGGKCPSSSSWRASALCSSKCLARGSWRRQASSASYGVISIEEARHALL